MQSEVIMAGFGGQGLMLIGKLLAQAGMIEGKEVCWLPSYGPEMRGGTANCTVVVADRPIGSPYVGAPAAAVVMNLPSWEKFGPAVRPSGLLVINSSLIQVPPENDRRDLTVLRVAANDLAQEVGNNKAANMVMLGAYVEAAGVVKYDTVRAQVQEAFAGKAKFLVVNLKALELGRRAVQKGAKGR